MVMVYYRTGFKHIRQTHTNSMILLKKVDSVHNDRIKKMLYYPSETQVSK